MELKGLNEDFENLFLRKLGINDVKIIGNAVQNLSHLADAKKSRVDMPNQPQEKKSCVPPSTSPSLAYSIISIHTRCLSFLPFTTPPQMHIYD
jgi:hypothetical protein